MEDVKLEKFFAVTLRSIDRCDLIKLGTVFDCLGSLQCKEERKKVMHYTVSFPKGKSFTINRSKYFSVVRNRTQGLNLGTSNNVAKCICSNK